MADRCEFIVERGVYAAIIRHALLEYPNECCGLLGCWTRAPVGHAAYVTDCYPLVNAAASPVEFRSEPRSLLKAVRAARAQQSGLVGTYHSHPQSAAIPSSVDCERSGPVWSVCFIVSLAVPRPIMRVWRWTPEGFRELAWRFAGQPDRSTSLPEHREAYPSSGTNGQ